MKKITVSLIAEKAQVSPATVSRVLNHRELVKEPTIRRVEEAMRSLGCQIENTVTVSKETQPLIVLNIPGIENVFYQEIIRGARVSAKAHGCHLLIHESHLNKGNLLDFCNLSAESGCSRRDSSESCFGRGPESDTSDRSAGTVL